MSEVSDPLQGLSGVLTGDLIASRRQSNADLDQAMQVLADTAQKIGQLHGFDPRFTRARGDGWQFWFPKPQRALRHALTLVAALGAGTKLETRVAIGIGRVDTLGSRNLSDAAGSVFVHSGDTLAALPDHVRMDIGGSGVDHWHRAVTHMADWIARGWTATQAEAYLFNTLMVRNNNSQRARELGISRQAFEARLKGTGLAVINDGLAAFAADDFGENRT